ncbi:MAG TPA: RsmE family RNA methyltransferase, partial [Pirellulaceae bacterium]|nr:RsmE family RNA methyltransferase [Pirellulaceae bacterium]
MREHRFHVEPVGESDRVVMAGSEAHHLRHVLRLEIGDEVTLFDGSGLEFAARIERTGKHEIELTVVERREVTVESPRRVSIASAVPKGDRQQVLLEKLVELGTACWLPVEWRRSAVRPEAKSVERWRRYVIEASKQCRRNRLMEVGDPTSAVDLFDRTNEPIRWLLDPSGEPIERAIVDGPDEVIVAIGPEGGIADDELEAARRHGWRVV